MTTARSRTWIAVVAASCLVFAAYAGSFLYFFVDDEAIPLVYARNLLRGRGLIYTALEGRGEGYSDFLHVLWSTVVLFIATGLNQSHLAPLLVGKAVSVAAGAGTIVVVAYWLRRTGATTPGVAAALGFCGRPTAIGFLTSSSTVCLHSKPSMPPGRMLSTGVRTSRPTAIVTTPRLSGRT